MLRSTEVHPKFSGLSPTTARATTPTDTVKLRTATSSGGLFGLAVLVFFSLFFALASQPHVGFVGERADVF